MLVVHHLGRSQSERIVWLCEELGLPYTLQRYDRDPKTMRPPEAYKKLHPMEMAPVITDGDLTLGESGAIVEYLLSRYGGGRLAVAPGAANYPDYLYWLHFANGTFMPTEMGRLTSAFYGVAADDPRLEVMTKRSERAYAMLEDRLGKTRYLAGDDFTAADIMNLFPLTTMRNFSPRDLSAYPNVRAYLARIGARPAYLAAMAKGDPGEPLQLS